MPIYKQTTEITKIDDVWANIDRDIVEVYFGDKNIFTVWSEYTGSLPITINANGDVLLDYRIYGANGGVGEPTESGEPAGYKLPMVSIEALDMTVEQGNINWKTGNDEPMAIRIRTVGKTPVKPSTTYTFKYDASDSDIQWAWRFYNGSTFLDDKIGPWENATNTTFTTPNNCDAVRMIFHYPNDYKDIVPSDVTNARIYENSSPVYIGENQLDADEYASYGEQKIYKRTENLFDKEQYLNSYISGKALNDAGTEIDAEYNGYSTYKIPVTAGETYTLKGTTSKIIADIRWFSRVYFFDSQNQFLMRSSYFENYTSDSVYTFTVPSGATSIELQMANQLTFDDLMLVKGSTAPESYIPYGLTPTDPPVPLPEIPTIDGTTIIDYDGTPKPSQMYVKYRKQYS